MTCSASRSAVSGDTIVVGAIHEDSNATGVNGNQANNLATSSGAAYVFVRNGTTWSQEAYLKASNTSIGDHFGEAVSISDDTVVVGAEDSNAIGEGSATRPARPMSSCATGRAGASEAYLKASNPGTSDEFGSSVSVSGDTIVVGAPDENSNATGVNGNQNNNLASFSGAAYVFVRNGTTWSQEAYLKASNTGANDWFGTTVAVSGDTVVVGAPNEDSNATGVNGDQSNNLANEFRRGLRPRAQRDELEPSCLPEGIQHRGGGRFRPVCLCLRRHDRRWCACRGQQCHGRERRPERQHSQPRRRGLLVRHPHLSRLLHRRHVS